MPARRDCRKVYIITILTVQSGDHGKEAEDDNQSDAGDKVDEDLEAKELVDLLADVVEVAVDAPENVELEEDWIKNTNYRYLRD